MRWIVLCLVLTACGSPPPRESGATGAQASGAGVAPSSGGEARGVGVVPSASASLDEAPPALPWTPELDFAVRRYARRWAVTIGINDYRGSVPDLGFAVSDAERMATLLGALGFEVVATLTDGEATRQGILDTLLGELADRVGPNDLVAVYFAGHGTTLGDMGFVVPQDGTLDVAGSALSVQELKETALSWQNRHTLFLVDACFSGTIFRRAHEHQEDPLRYWRSVTDQRLVEILTAGDAGEEVLEREGWGLFTRSVFDGLASGGADAARDGVISGRELAAFVRMQVARVTSAQHPQWGLVEGAGTVLLVDARRVAPPRERVTRDLTVVGAEGELARVQGWIDGQEYRRAETALRRLALDRPDPVLNLILAELYLEQDPRSNGHRVEHELDAAEAQGLDAAGRGALRALRRRLAEAQRRL
ncbi:MAG: caspase domain-containing protein [Sandaracinaceae bacterium]